MKIIGIGDLLIPQEYIENAFTKYFEGDYEIKTVDWDLDSYDQLQNINLDIEQHGPNCIDIDDKYINEINEAEVLITQFFPINKKVIDACANLKFIGVLRGGYENVDVDYAKQKGITVYHTPGRNANAVADFTVGMILSEMRNIARSHYNLKNGDWVRDYTNKGRVYDLEGKTVGIVGFGEIGRKVAKRLNGFDMNILTFDPYQTDFPSYVKKVELNDLLKLSNVVTLHCRLTKDNERLINSESLEIMREDAYLINTARSGLVDEKALYDALISGKIIGAALDVFDQEPPGKDYPLVTLENVTITPHLAGGTTDAFTNSPILLAKEMRKSIENKNSKYII